jgi:ATP-dependent RNA helicase SUPV3L1/SUV3
LHRAVTLYLWLSYRFSGVLTSQALAFHVRGLVEERINACLAHVDYTIESIERHREMKRKSAMQRLKRGAALGMTNEAANDELPDEGPGRWEEEGHEEPLAEDDKEYDGLEAESGETAHVSAAGGDKVDVASQQGN